jgi:two-component system, chemotaxis family, protein-glutamate methylesterase/glutaminase
MIRVLVVEDSPTVRHHLVETLAQDPGITVVGEAPDGRRAVEMCTALRPDVVTIDMVMPDMTGLAATEQIMAYCPTPILIVSASSNRGEVFKTFDALAAGAVDAFDKPSASTTEGAWETGFIARVKLVARIRVITHPRARLAGYRPGGRSAMRLDRRPRVVAIGASTGGPVAVRDLLAAMPGDFTIPILLVIHIGATFGHAMAQWLDSQSPLRVSHVRDGEPLPTSGRVIMAEPDRHLALVDGALRSLDAPERHFCRPSVDALFESVARASGSTAIGCLLTGMGRDGAEGLLAIERAGGATIAQDEATSVIFGMPKEAIRIGAARHVLPLGMIAPALAAMMAEPAP